MIKNSRKRGVMETKTYTLLTGCIINWCNALENISLALSSKVKACIPCDPEISPPLSLHVYIDQNTC